MTWHPQQPRLGFWRVKCCRECPFVAARIWLAHTTTDPETGYPMERSPFLAAQIGLDIVDWREVWALVEFCEASPEQQAALANPPEVTRSPRAGRKPALQYVALAKWKQARGQRISEAEYTAEAEWLAWASRNKPTHPDFTYRRAADRAAIPAPRFS